MSETFIEVPSLLAGLDRLDWRDEWLDLQNEIGQALDRIDCVVRELAPTVGIKKGFNHGGDVLLFVYRVYSLSTGIDPVVVGFTVYAAEEIATDAYRLRGDIVGELNGDDIFEAASVERIGVLAMTDAVHAMGNALCGQAAAIVAALDDQKRRAL